MKTTMKEFERFKKECLRVCKLFGLKDWCITFSHRKTGGNASCTLNASIRCAEFRLSKTVNEWYKGPEWSAKHEVGHILIGRLSDMSKNGEADWIVDIELETFCNSFANGLTEMEAR